MKDDASRDWDRWGPLAARYRPERPRRILALDGGGIRGLITLEVLRRLESELATATGVGETFRLCDFFDLVGGTSTGAIIAAGLARGMSVEEISKFYQTFGRKVFVRRGVIAASRKGKGRDGGRRRGRARKRNSLPNGDTHPAARRSHRATPPTMSTSPPGAKLINGPAAHPGRAGHLDPRPWVL